MAALIPLINQVSFEEKLLFTKHLSVMIKSGITLSEAIDALYAQTTNPGFSKVLGHVLAQIRNGKSFADALKTHPEVFDEFFVSLVEVGEQSGTLETNLEFLSIQLSKDNSLRKKVKGALLYPGVVLSAVGIMGGFIALVVLPQLVTFFNSFEVELPVTTQILLWVADIMKNWGIFIVGFGVAGVIAFSILVKTPQIKPIWHAMLLRTPLLGKIIRYSQLARFSRNLGTLLTSGVPVTLALETTSNSLGNVAYKRATSKILIEVKKGKQIADAMTKNPKLFPIIVSKMVGVGEKTGKLDESLLYLGDFFEEEVDNFSRNLSTVLEPFLLIFIGLVVGFIAIAIVSPIYELTGSIRR